MQRKEGSSGVYALIAQSKLFSTENSMNMETMQQMHYAEQQKYVNYFTCLFGAFPHHSPMVWC